MVFFFPKADVLNLVEHAEKALSRRAIEAQQGSVKANADIPPGLWFVKKQHVFLMSNGTDTSSPEVYARGFAPNENAVSGKDTVYWLPLTALQLHAKTKDVADWLAVSYSFDQPKVSWQGGGQLKAS